MENDSNRRNAIMLVEWRHQGEPTHDDPQHFLWHHIVLSLLYDEVLAQDDAFIYGHRFADWIAKDPTFFPLLSNLFDCRGLTILKRPVESYPKHLQELAANNPITARSRLYSESRVTFKGDRIEFTPEQIGFQKALEARLDRPSSAHRFGQRAPGLMKNFSELFFEVLTRREYKPWLEVNFPSAAKHAHEFAAFALDPGKAIERLHNLGIANARRVASDGPQFIPGLAIQVAASYAPLIAKEFQSLTETVFARPLCQGENNADGRYGRRVRSLPTEQDDGTPLDHVEVKLLTHIPLPELKPGFADIINKVRELPSGRDLRIAMQNLKAPHGLDYVASKWRALADDLATEIRPRPAILLPLVAILSELNNEAYCQILIADPLHSGPTALSKSLNTLKQLPGNALEAVRAELEWHKIRDDLTGLLEFSCQSTPVIGAR